MACFKCDNEVVPGSYLCADCEAKAFNKIGGWLWIPAFGLIISILLNIYNTYTGVKFYLINRDFLGDLVGLVAFELVGIFFLLLLCIYATYLFFNRKKLLPGVIIALIALVLIHCAVDLAWAYYGYDADITDYQWYGFMRSVCSAIIWIPYFSISIRVKKTFVH